MKRKAFIVLLFLCVLYLGDAVVLLLPIPGRQPYGVVQVRRYYVMPLKGGKTEYGYDGTENESCAQSLFPHSGLPPCWYASRHTEKWITQ
ncbi:MAG: hypothetical protein ACLQDV_00750 [Candidatus Binataceae bacterium]